MSNARELHRLIGLPTSYLISSQRLYTQPFASRGYALLDAESRLGLLTIVELVLLSLQLF